MTCSLSNSRRSQLQAAQSCAGSCGTNAIQSERRSLMRDDGLSALSPSSLPFGTIGQAYAVSASNAIGPASASTIGKSLPRKTRSERWIAATSLSSTGMIVTKEPGWYFLGERPSINERSAVPLVGSTKTLSVSGSQYVWGRSWSFSRPFNGKRILGHENSLDAGLHVFTCRQAVAQF